MRMEITPMLHGFEASCFPTRSLRALLVSTYPSLSLQRVTYRVLETPWEPANSRSSSLPSPVRFQTCTGNL